MHAFPVSESKLRGLTARMESLGVKEGDLEESFVRSSGPGGQNVNKVATCVMLSHPASRVSVRCQSTRSQALNRFLARRMLLDELEARRSGTASRKQKLIWKIRRQKARRSRRAKQRILEQKHFNSAKKGLRGPVREGRDY